ncbi:type II secretion system protein GspD [Kiritimatiella glycovorans]|uniref:type II secretion system protein GspD n=1 Tax=Kiritimatiella glycovorans TaxID=1307763 RepID=UPI00069B53CF|nr:hypothetical protein [Kiritimatiella glycovorans]
MPVASTQAQDTNEAIVIESVFVRDMALRDFAELMTRGCEADWKVLVSEKAGEKRISFYLSDTGIDETLRSICATYGLWYRRSRRSDIIQIETMEEYREGLNLYADEAVEVVPVMYPAPEEIGDALARLFQDRVVWDPPPEDIADDMPRIESALDRMDTMADRATLVDSENLGGTTTGYRDRYDGSSYRRRTGDTWDRTGRYGSRSGRATEEQTVEEVVEQQQRSLEAQQAVRGIPEDIGGRNDRPGLVYISASPSANALILRSSDAASVETIKTVIQQLDKPKPQVLLEVKVLDILLDDESARGVDWLFQNSTGDGQMLSGGRATGITAEPGNSIRSSDPFSLVPQGTGIDPLASVFSFVSADVRARIQLLQDEQRIHSLATPSLLVADNEASRVFIGSEVTILKSVELNAVRDIETGLVLDYETEPQTEEERIGTTLLITPKIHADRTVTIRILQEETKLGDERTIEYGDVGEQFRTQDIDERSVTTTVLAKDKHTVAIGGLIRERQADRETGVPLLMNIPLLGNLFKRTVKSDERSELLVLIRPYVVLAPGDAESASKQFLETVGSDGATLEGGVREKALGVRH